MIENNPTQRGTDGRTDGQGATLYAVPREGRIITCERVVEC